MKTQGFTYKNIPLSEALDKGIELPNNLSLWGSVTNFNVVKDEKYTQKVFLLYYFDEIVAGLIYSEQKHFHFLKTGHSPHPNQSVPYAHIYIQPQDSQRAHEQLLEEFVTQLSRIVTQEFISFTLFLPPEFQDVREFNWCRWDIYPRYTYYVDLPEMQKVGLSSFVGKKIRNIIKNTKATLQIKEISAVDFFGCYRQTYMRQHKSTPKTLKFFEQLYSLPNMYFYGAFREDILTSGVIISVAGDTAYFVTSGTLDSHHNSNGVTYLLYNYLEQLLTNPERNTIKYFDFVGANTKRVALFKTNFQPKLKGYFSVSKSKLPVTIIKKLLRKYQ